eukprot:13737311-Alexandrium_andersonii.AAC.1
MKGAPGAPNLGPVRRTGSPYSYGASRLACGAPCIVDGALVWPRSQYTGPVTQYTGPVTQYGRPRMQ